MSLDNIQLPVNIIHSMYSKSLYDLNPDKSDANTVNSDNISFLGNNQKKIMILISSADAIYLPDDELNFLLGILNACKLSMADIALINVSQNPTVSYKNISDQFKAEQVLLFGLSPESISLPLQFPHYQIQQFNNQVYLSAVTLKELQADKEEKMKLWNSLKKIFSIV